MEQYEEQLLPAINQGSYDQELPYNEDLAMLEKMELSVLLKSKGHMAFQVSINSQVQTHSICQAGHHSWNAHLKWKTTP